MKIINCIALVLVVIGALNWGMVGFFQIDVVASIFGGVDSIGARVIYSLIGLAGLWSLSFFRWFCCCHPCRDDLCGTDKGDCCSTTGSGTSRCCGHSKESCSSKDNNHHNGDKCCR